MSSEKIRNFNFLAIFGCPNFQKTPLPKFKNRTLPICRTSFEDVPCTTSGVTLTMFSIRRPPAEIFGAPTAYKVIFLLSPKKKKGRHYFFGFSFRLLAPPGAFWRPLKLFGDPWSFLYPKYFFPHHRTLIWPTYGTFLQPNNFNSKFWRPLLMAPPGDAGATLRHCVLRPLYSVATLVGSRKKS